MTFEEFEKQYQEEAAAAGLEVTVDEIAKIYLGISIVTRWQYTQAKKAHKRARMRDDRAYNALDT